MERRGMGMLHVYERRPFAQSLLRRKRELREPEVGYSAASMNL